MIDCKKLAQSIKDQCKKDLEGVSKPYYLKIIQVEGDEASNAYTKGKKKDCEDIGLGCQHILLPNNCNYPDVLTEIYLGNGDENCCGIILQLPLPPHLEPFKRNIISRIAPSKDVDGFVKYSPYTPCTPAGIIEILKSVTNEIAGKHCVVIGRSEIVGYPTFELLNKLNATVTLCNSHTPPDMLQQVCLHADVIISATGVPNLISYGHVCEDTIVIDAGISRDKDGKLCGDCDKELYDFVKNITIVPGGVGLMTRAVLMKNCVQSVVKNELSRGIFND